MYCLDYMMYLFSSLFFSLEGGGGPEIFLCKLRCYLFPQEGARGLGIPSWFVFTISFWISSFSEKDQLLNIALVGKLGILDRCPEEDTSYDHRMLLRRVGLVGFKICGRDLKRK